MLRDRCFQDLRCVLQSDSGQDLSVDTDTQTDLVLAGLHAEAAFQGDFVFPAFFLDHLCQIINDPTGTFYITCTTDTVSISSMNTFLLFLNDVHRDAVKTVLFKRTVNGLCFICHVFLHHSAFGDLR